MPATAMKKLLRKILFGDIPVREYATVTVEGEIVEKVFLENGTERTDVSSLHWLLCLKPVIFGIWTNNAIAVSTTYRMFFYDSAGTGQPVAELDLDFFEKIEDDSGTLLLLRLTTPRIHHLGFLKTRLLYYKHYKKPEQDFYTLQSYAAAYSYPRKVRLISFRDGDYQNIFPMDLVGDVPCVPVYVFGLRHTNTTLRRIIATRKMVVSEVPYVYKNIIYQLGKHHKDPQKAADDFPVTNAGCYGFPIPGWANSYKEIEITRTLNLGSHMLLFGKELNAVTLSPANGHLYHIHFLHYLHQHKKKRAYPMV